MAKTLVEILQENKIELIDSGSGRWVASCPFHEGDRDPSFTIYPTNTYFCWGCEVWGDAVKFLVDYKKMPYKEALEYVGEQVKYRPDRSKVIKLRNLLESWKFIGKVSEEYHQYLLNTPGALSYLYKRGLTDETIRKYKLGYTDGHVLKLQFSAEYQLATEVGLTTKDGYELFSHRITIPNLLDKGEADFLVGRTVVNAKTKYLGLRAPKPIHGFFEVCHSPIIFLAEGQFDWLTLRQWGFPAAVLGGSHLTKAHQALLSPKQIVVVPDNDDTGMSVARSLQDKLANISIIDYSTYGVKDISEFAQIPGAREMFIDIVREQVPWIMSLSTRVLNRYFPSLQKELLSL